MAAPRRTLFFPKSDRPLDLALVAVLIAIVIQLIPLPASLVATLSPHAAEVRAAVRFSAFGQSAPSWMTLTVNPAATLGRTGDGVPRRILVLDRTRHVWRRRQHAHGVSRARVPGRARRGNGSHPAGRGAKHRAVRDRARGAQRQSFWRVCESQSFRRLAAARRGAGLWLLHCPAAHSPDVARTLAAIDWADPAFRCGVHRARRVRAGRCAAIDPVTVRGGGPRRGRGHVLELRTLPRRDRDRPQQDTRRAGDRWCRAADARAVRGRRWVGEANRAEPRPRHWRHSAGRPSGASRCR